MIDTQQLQTLNEQVQAIQTRLKHLNGVRASIQNSLSQQGFILSPLSTLGMAPMFGFARNGSESLAEVRAQDELVGSATKLIDTYIFQTTYQLQAAEDAIKALCGVNVPERVGEVVVTETIMLSNGVDFIPSSFKVECSHPLVLRCEVVSSNYVTEPSRSTHVNVKVVFICPLDAETIGTINLPASLSVAGITANTTEKVLFVLS